MHLEEASNLLRDELEKWRSRSYEEFVKLIGETLVVECAGPSGQGYIIEVDVLWDGPPGGTIRVLASIDDGGVSSLAPLCENLLVERPWPAPGTEPSA
jgi:hypothetical protein